VNCNLFSEGLAGFAAEEESDGRHKEMTAPKDRHKFKHTFISSLWFERLRVGVRNFVGNGKERLFCEISYKEIGNVSGVPRGNTSALASS
jgi:hypothetical protein